MDTFSTISLFFATSTAENVSVPVDEEKTGGSGNAYCVVA
jgi:hypothetical protein